MLARNRPNGIGTRQDTDDTYVSYAYDNTGALATITDSASGVKASYCYDFSGRLSRYEEWGNNYSYILAYTYSDDDRLTYVRESVNGHSRGGALTYDEDERLISFKRAYAQRVYTYDDFDRVSQTVTTHDFNTTVLTTTYTFSGTGTSAASSQISGMRNVSSGYNTAYSYTYDNNGNILTVSDGTHTTSYVYNSQGS